MSDAIQSSSVVNLSGFEKRVYAAWPDFVEYTTYTPSSRTAVRHAAGSKNPRWKEQIRRGQQAGSPFTAYDLKLVSMSESSATETVRYYTGDKGYFTTSCKALPPFISSEAVLKTIPLDQADNTARSKLFTKAISKQQQLMTGVMLGELGETLRLITRRGKSLRRGFDDYFSSVNKRMKSQKNNRDRLEAASDTWLEYSFGWKPLVNDINDSIDYIKNEGLNQPKWVQVRAVGTQDSSSISQHLHSQSFPYLFYDWINVWSGSVRYIACVDVGTNSEHRLRSLGLSPEGWLPTTWELIPWSFVVDYFTNIGDIVNALSFVQSNFRWVIKTTRQTEKLKGVCKPPNKFYSYGELGGVVRGKTEIESKVIQRSIPTTVSVPTLGFEMPGLSTKWINLAALAFANKRSISIFN